MRGGCRYETEEGMKEGGRGAAGNERPLSTANNGVMAGLLGMSTRQLRGCYEGVGLRDEKDT